MSYTLIHTEILVATETIRCDGVKSFFDKTEHLKKKELTLSLKHQGDIVVIVKNKLGNIKQGSKYVYREFVDEQGELHVLNTGIDMDKVAKRNELYPSIIQNQI